MPPTLVNVAVGILLGVALLGAAFDRHSIAIVAAVAGIPDLDAVISLVVPGATNAALHTLFIPAIAAALLYYDTEHRADSWLRRRYGWYGVRVAWVAIAAYAVAGIGLDLFNIESAAALYPVSDRYYSIVGRFILSTQEGVIQTYIEVADGWLKVASPGTTETHHVNTWINPTPGTGNPAGVERNIRIVDSGWQFVLVVTAVAAVPAKYLIERGDV
ncbi:MAG: hypothetical protein ACI8UR_002038 [Natronomonas sp.]|jgi:hypothetical protein|uniref:hypothetical protein n=1 Tax=Natronomonas sp. TaxID=2184060 RepID=UPI00398A2D51